jgi:hypothetical protein
MIVNEKDKFVIDYYPMNSNIADEIQNPDKICENILNNFNEHPKELNNLYDLNRWDEYKDNILSQLVLFYNFDFKKIADVFDKLCNIKRETDLDGGEIPVYTEKILRYHWSFIHARRFFGKKTGEEFYILNRDEKCMKLNEDKFEQKESEKEKEKENFPKDITTDKNLVNTINVNSLNKEKDLNSYFDKLLNQEMDKERTKLFEMELKEKAPKNDSFPINISKNDGEKKVNDIINNIKQKEKYKKEEIERQKIEKQKEEEKEMEY